MTTPTTTSLSGSKEAVRPPGRPAQSTDVRDKLIHHARLLFIAQPYDKVSLRMVAANAEVNMAMIRYYFNNKAGLFETMLRETLRPMYDAVTDNTANSGDNFLILLMKNFYQVMGRHKNFPRLINRSMQLSRETLPRQIVEKVMLQHLPIVRSKIHEVLNSEGVLKPGASAQLCHFTMINLMVFPFVATPEMLKMHNIDINDDFLTDLLEHNTRLLSQGIINP